MVLLSHAPTRRGAAEQGRGAGVKQRAPRHLCRPIAGDAAATATAAGPRMIRAIIQSLAASPDLPQNRP